MSAPFPVGYVHTPILWFLLACAVVSLIELRPNRAVLKAWWARKQNRVLLEVLLTAIGSIALLVWRPGWKMPWFLFGFAATFGWQRILVLVEAPPVLSWAIKIVAVVLATMAVVVVSSGHFGNPVSWSAVGLLVGAWSRREERRRERTTG